MTKGLKCTVLAKLGFFNPLSSVKDRIGLAMIEAAEHDGKIGRDTTAIEPTSGNTGIALAFVCVAQAFAGRWGNVYSEATITLGRDLADCLTFFRFPERHWKRLRTSNGLERWFAEVRRRTRVIGRFPTELSPLSLVCSVSDETAKTWHGMIMDGAHQQLAASAPKSLHKNPIVVKGFEELLAA